MIRLANMPPCRVGDKVKIWVSGGYYCDGKVVTVSEVRPYSRGFWTVLWNANTCGWTWNGRCVVVERCEQ